MKSLIAALLCALINLSSFASSVSAVAPGGDWSDAGTWDASAPGCYDTIIIPAGASVVMDGTVDLTSCGAVSIIVEGNLHFTQSNKLELPCGSWVLFVEGPPDGSMTADNYSNNSKQLKICGSAVWKGKDGVVNGPAGFGNAPLPIELIHFMATYNEITRRVDLNWATASESDNDYFTVERSKNGVDWTEVLEVDGAGTVSVKTEYHEEDTKPMFGDSYYRLKQTDMNGDFSYSPIVRVNQSVSEIVMYPNPVDQGKDVVINFPKNYAEEVQLNIVSMEGKIVYQEVYDVSDSQQIIVNIGVDFIPGMYLVNLNYESVRLVVK